ncbi:hypothetical protein Bca101_009149 [Brassica carinata]
MDKTTAEKKDGQITVKDVNKCQVKPPKLRSRSKSLGIALLITFSRRPLNPEKPRFYPIDGLVKISRMALSRLSLVY